MSWHFHIIKIILTNYIYNQNSHSLYAGFLGSHSFTHQSFIKVFCVLALEVFLGTKHKKDKINSSFEKLNIYWKKHLMLVHYMYAFVHALFCLIFAVTLWVMFYHNHFRGKETSQLDKRSNLLAPNSSPIHIPWFFPYTTLTL